jgi:hypothetical protein
MLCEEEEERCMACCRIRAFAAELYCVKEKMSRHTNAMLDPMIATA